MEAHLHVGGNATPDGTRRLTSISCVPPANMMKIATYTVHSREAR